MSKSKRRVPAVLVCERTGVQFEYRGFGRPPKYSPEARKDIERERRQSAYAAKQAKKGKTVKPRLAA